MNHFLGAVVISCGYSPQRCRSCSRKVKHTQLLLLFHPVTDRKISVWGGGGPFRFKPCVRLPRYRTSRTDIFISSRSSRPSLCRHGGSTAHAWCQGWGVVLHFCGWRAGDRINEGWRSSNSCVTTRSLKQKLVFWCCVTSAAAHLLGQTSSRCSGSGVTQRLPDQSRNDLAFMPRFSFCCSRCRC